MSDKEMSNYIELNNVEIEEVDEFNLTENELCEFVDAPYSVFNETQQPHSSACITEIDTPINETEEILIKKLIDGELTFSEYKAQLGRNDEDIEQEDYEENLDERLDETAGPDDANDILFQSRKDQMRGQQGGTSENRQRRKRSILPPALQGLMGEANLCYARGDIVLAEKVCFEIIRQVPLASEPFLTLAQIYETSDIDKFMQFSLISAHLNPADSDQWIRLAELSIEQGNVKQAIACYSKAIKSNPKNIELRLRRIELLESIGEHKFAFRCNYAMLSHIPTEEGEFLLKTAKMVAQRFHKENNMAKALDAMSRAYSKIPNLFTTEDINLLLELLLATGNYKTVLDILCDYIGFSVELEQLTDGYRVLSCLIPDNMVLDFRTKLSVALIHMKTFHLLDYLLSNTLQYIDVEEAGDCYLDIAEALMKEEKFTEALKLLIPLVNSKNFSLAAVWLRHADCYRAIGDFERAIESYKNVIELAPQHLDARLTLSALLKQKGRDEEALKALEQDLESELLDPGLLYERCFILKDTGNLKQYIDVGFLLISRHCMKLRNKEEVATISNITRLSSRRNGIKELRQLRSENVEDTEAPEFSKSENEPTLEVEWNLFKDILATAYDLGMFSMLQKLTFFALTSKRFLPYMPEIEFMTLLSCIYNRDQYFSYIFAKEYIVKDWNNSICWNLLNMIIQYTDDSRYYKFLMRLLNKRVIDPFVHILQANYYLVSGTYKYALNDFMSIFKRTNTALSALLIGVTLCQMASQKYTAKKHALITQALAYFKKYQELREPEAMHEINYNFGRIYHQLGMLPLAMHHYNEVFKYDNELIQAHPNYLDLKREAAFNLHLIYKNVGNFDMARKILYDYIVV